MTTREFPIPDEALDDRLAFVGTSGSGKTYGAGGAVERLLESGARVVVVDPLDVWFGLRLTADGKPSKHNVVIFGGAHADIPLNDHAGALIGETVAGMKESCIVSLGGMHTKASERRFMLAFLDSLYRKANPSKADPFHVVFDEADLWAPQRSTEPMLQSRMEEIVRRGRIKGFIPWLITQRPAVLSKDVLSQADGLIAFKLMASQDRDAIGGWIEGQADRAVGKEMLASLPTMQRGQGVVWLPGRGILETATFPPKKTFDSSRTPKRGERKQRRDLKPLNIDALKGQLAGLEEEQKANDPAALKAEIIRLTREVAKKVPQPPAPKPLPAPAVDEAALLAAQSNGARLALTRVRAMIDEELKLVGKTKVVPKPNGGGTVAGIAVDTPADQMVVAAETIGGPHQRILNALAWWEVLGHGQPINEQVAFIANYSPKSTSYQKARGALRTAGKIDYPSAGRISLTDLGMAEAEGPGEAPSGDLLRRRVLSKLGGPHQRILKALMDVYPEALSNQECADRSEYSPLSTSYQKARGALKTLTAIDYPSPGNLRASDWLFPNAGKK
ncbi:MAG: hypothetical protein V4696_03510 [Pseudomonadota bacterium]